MLKSTVNKHITKKGKIKMKQENPYRDGSAYNKVFNDLKDSGSNGVTRDELLSKGHKTSDITVVLSPRAEGSSTRNGDCRGSISAKGHLYYVEKFKEQGKPARFVLEWRSSALEKKARTVKKDIESQKSHDESADTKSSTETEAMEAYELSKDISNV